MRGFSDDPGSSANQRRPAGQSARAEFVGDISNVGDIPSGNPMRVLIALGTRPEALKMAPLIWALKEDPFFEVKVAISAQHRDMLDSVTQLFSIDADFDLNIMGSQKDLHGLTAGILSGMSGIYLQWRPDIVLVHGDTTTAFAAALAAFYQGIAIGHVEAGLRTYNKFAPWPEESNRRMIACIADIHFAPTSGARDNLISEGIRPGNVHVTGNTAVDTISITTQRIANDPALHARLAEKFALLDPTRKLIVATFHRRENIGDSVVAICRALATIAKRGDVHLVVPLHPNPAIRIPAMQMLADLPNLTILEPQDYVSFVYLLSKCTLVLTDSGGLQEEAPFLGTPLLLMRDVTERPEAVEIGAVHLVGTDYHRIVTAVTRLLDDPAALADMSNKGNPFGDGQAATRIRGILKQGVSMPAPVADSNPITAAVETTNHLFAYDTVSEPLSVEMATP